MAGSSLSHLLPVLEGNSSYMVLTEAEVVDFTGGSPGPSAKAAEANDKSKSATASTFFMLFSL
jgi:hypothetical protein